MQQNPRSLPFFLALGLVATACVDNSDDDATTAGGSGGASQGVAATLNGIDLDADGDGDGIVDLPAGVPSVITDVFRRYTAVEAPGGGRIHLLAQQGVDNARLRRAREVMRQHLTDVPGTAEGASKADVADAMATAGATLAIFREPASASAGTPENAAFLAAFGDRAWAMLATRIVVEGTPEYLAASPADDNTFGATAALVLRAGLANARPQYAAEARQLAEARIASGDFTPPPGLAAMGRDEAFVTLVLDVHSGVWAHDPNGTGRAGVFGDYAWISRHAMAAGDPATLDWVERFFSPRHDFLAQVTEGFTGTFECLPRQNLAYTNRSRYLRAIQLLGTHQAELFGAPEASWLIGNDGNNNLKGRGGDDIILGEGGFDTVVYDGPGSEYTVTFQFGEVFIQDSVPGRDGNDRCKDIERISFSDGNMNL